jgi:hypothetical protein
MEIHLKEWWQLEGKVSTVFYESDAWFSVDWFDI